MDFVVEAQSIGKVAASLAELPSRIDPAKLQSLSQKVADQIGAIDELKKKLSAAVNAKDSDVKDLKARMVDIRSAVKGTYGADSTEYELVGGTRKSERKKPGRKPVK
jgi:hypothetical protein